MAGVVWVPFSAVLNPFCAAAGNAGVDKERIRKGFWTAHSAAAVIAAGGQLVVSPVRGRSRLVNQAAANAWLVANAGNFQVVGGIRQRTTYQVSGSCSH
jgi:hypothetical protein